MTGICKRCQNLKTTAGQNYDKANTIFCFLYQANTREDRQVGGKMKKIKIGFRTTFQEKCKAVNTQSDCFLPQQRKTSQAQIILYRTKQSFLNKTLTCDFIYNILKENYISGNATLKQAIEQEIFLKIDLS